MNEILSRYKYTLSTALAVATTAASVALFLFPKTKSACEILATVRSELDSSATLAGETVSPDSLVENYRKVSSEQDSYMNVSVSSSKILTFIVETSRANGVTVQDLSTGEVKGRGGRFEYPVKFKARATFPQFRRFLTALENGAYCVKIENVDMLPGESSVRLSVLGREAKDE